MSHCTECGERFYREATHTDDDLLCDDCLGEIRRWAKRGGSPQRLALSVTLTLTPCQFFYLRDAVKRDLENLEEMAPWDIDDQTAEHEDEIRMCKGMIALLGKVEQTQVIPH